MKKTLRICFLLATNPIDVKWHATLAFGYLKAHTERLFPGQIEYHVAQNLKDAVRFHPDILGISSTSQDFEEAIILCEGARTAKVSVVILGGFHITAFPETLPKAADIGVLGEGEITFGEIVSLLLNKGTLLREDLQDLPGIIFWNDSGLLQKTETRPQLANLDYIPLPDRFFGLADDQQPYLLTSRGCPYHCSFCASSIYWSNVRFHSAERVITEIKHILNLFPAITAISIWDDLFAADKRRLRKIVELFEANELNRRISLGSSVRANLIDAELCGLLRRLNYSSIGFGAESGSDVILKKLKDKRSSVAINQRALDVAKQHGLQSACGFILGHYDETEEDLLKTYEFILNNYAAGKLVRHEITILTPMPGTALWKWAEQNGFITPDAFHWSSLRYLALYSNNLKSVDKWIVLRKSNGSMYLNDRNVPQEHLFQVIRYYEDKIRRKDFTKKRPMQDDTGTKLRQYYLHRREDIISAIPKKAFNILDIGCAGGGLGKALKELEPQRRVVGVEINKEAHAHATHYLDLVYRADIEAFDPPFTPAEFDCIVFADILEHLRDPWEVVNKYTQFLKPGGAFIASIPNIRRLTILRELADQGSWEYQDEGILDRTHLRFFTKKEFIKLLKGSHIHEVSIRNLYGEDLRRFTPTGPKRIVRLGRLSLEDVSDEEFEELSALQFLFIGTYNPHHSQDIEDDAKIHKAYCSAQALIHEGRCNDGIAALEELVATYPACALAQNDLGVLLVQKGDLQKARSHYEKALRLKPENVTFLKNLADFYTVVEGNISEAQALYQKVISLQPDDKEALNALSIIATALHADERVEALFGKPPKSEAVDFVIRAKTEKARLDDSLLVGSGSKQFSPLELNRVGSFDDYAQYSASMLSTFEERKKIEENLIGKGKSFTVQGTCVICRIEVAFHVDFFASRKDESGRYIPNWRERLVCPSCGLINRCRAVIHILEQILRPSENTSIFIAEQTTPVYHWLLKHYSRTIGSEFLGNQIPLGFRRPDGIRNEDLTALTFPDDSFDCAMTYDVFEHIPDYRRAFLECQRVLKPNGVLMFTAPFDSNSRHTIIRARQNADGTVEHILPAEYHGDPLSRFKGCLCYQVFGWDIIEELSQAGFEDAAAYYYWSRELGYLGINQMIFLAKKRKPQKSRTDHRYRGWDELGEVSHLETDETLDRAHLDRARKAFAADQIENLIGKNMKYDWDHRAKENAKYYVHSINEDQTEDEFSQSGFESVKKLIIDDLSTISQGKDPKAMKVLEIGCGIGRMTKYLAQVFGEVYGVDVSGEMIRIAKDRLRQVSNVVLEEGSGKNLALYTDASFDFVFSFIVFQHIPYREVIFNYVAEAYRVLKPGGIFKFQVQGCINPAWLALEKDTWQGETITEEDINELSFKHGYEIVKKYGQGTQYSFYTLKKSEKIDREYYKTSEIWPQLFNVCSIVIPVFNKVEFTKKCIAAIQQNTPKDLYEVIVVDNASTDDTRNFLRNLRGNIRCISNSENVGFTLACNQGAKIATGEFIIFLNNDTEPQQGWLDSMVELAQADATIGVVGSKLTYPNGRLQEAGGIVFSDGSGWNYGRFGDPEDPSFNFVREVDYVSGAALLVRHDLLKQLNYFDEQFSPGYYEDTDLCFGIRSLGYKVMYCPFSVVVHHEGISSGTDLKQGMKKYQTINRDKFVAKWTTALRNQCCAAPQHVITASERGISGNILIIDPFLPMFDRASGSLRLYTIISLLRKQGYHITFIARNGHKQEAYSDALSKMGVEVYATDADMLRQMGYAVHARPFDLKRILAARRYQFAILSFYDIAEQYLPIIRSASPETRILIDTVDIHFVREMRQAELSGDPVGLKRAAATKERELSIYSQADGVITVTERDWDHIGPLVSGKPHFVIPNIHSIDESPIDLDGRSGLLFVGNFNHKPNIDAILYFVQEILPIVKRTLPDMTLTIVGNNPPEEILSLECKSVLVAGYVPSTEPYLKKARVSIAPLRYGAGMKGKIGEAMAHGLPVVTTSIGAEGMGLVSGETALISDSHQEFADHIITLCTNDDTWQSIASAARQLILDNFSPQKVSFKLVEMLQRAESLRPIDITHVKQAFPSRVNKAIAKGHVSIIILTFNQLKYTQECVESIRKHTPEPHEIIFVDNGSNDGTLKWLRKLIKSNSNYKLIENKKNLGFSKGCNQGIEASTGEYILLLNNDVVITENWLAGMLECLKSAPDIGIVGPMTNNISGPQKVPVVDYSSLGGLAAYAQAFWEKNRYRRILYPRIVGFCMLFNRELVEEIGLLDESFGSGNFEDDDFCLRASLAGYRNVIAGDVFIHHYGSRSFIGNRIDYGSSLSGNRKIFNDKWSGTEMAQRFGKRLVIVSAINRADEFYRKGQMDSAISTLLEGIKQTPGDKGLYFNLVEMLIDSKRYKDALELLEAMRPDDTDTKKIVLTGYCEEGLGHNDKAAECADRALGFEPSMPQALNLKGVVVYKRGELDTAESFFKKAMESAPSFGESYTNLGVVKWDAGEQTEALALFERGFLLSPTTADAVTAYHSAVTDTAAFARAETVFREARALFPNDKRIAFFLIATLIQLQQHDLAVREIELAMMQFGIDEGILSAALDVRAKTGPQEIQNKGSSKNTLSLCMIVKNEEQHLARCLMSVKPIVNEIIVVDTGSTDRTRNIALAFGAKVFDFPWTNDFSEARNYSLSKASGDWILVLDADEIVSPRDNCSLKKILSNGLNQRAAYLMVTRNYTDQVGARGWTANDGKYIEEENAKGWVPSTKVRLFPYDKRIKFENPVHELVEPTLKKAGIKIKTCNIPVHHYGRLNQDKVVTKGEEYYLLGMKKILETKGDYYALKELAIQASELGKYEEAVRIWERAIELNPNDAVAYMNVGYAYLMLDQYGKASIFSKNALELDPDLREAALNYAGCELIAGDVKKAIVYLEKMLEKEPDYPPAMGRIAAAYLVDGQKKKGLKCLERLRKNGYDCASILEEQARALLSQGRTDQAELLRAIGNQIKGAGQTTLSLYADCKRIRKSKYTVSDHFISHSAN